MSETERDYSSQTVKVNHRLIRQFIISFINQASNLYERKWTQRKSRKSKNMIYAYFICSTFKRADALNRADEARKFARDEK